MELVVNVTEDWGIGYKGELLVAISEDLKRFRQLTTGKTVILGRKTLSTFPGGRPLKNRRNLILSGSVSEVAGAEVYPDIPSLLSAIKGSAPDTISVIGGATVYEALLPYCHKAYVTKNTYSGPTDTWFPNLDKLENWTVEKESEVYEDNGVRYWYVDYVNRSPLPL